MIVLTSIGSFSINKNVIQFNPPPSPLPPFPPYNNNNGRCQTYVSNHNNNTLNTLGLTNYNPLFLVCMALNS